MLSPDQMLVRNKLTGEQYTVPFGTVYYSEGGDQLENASLWAYIHSSPNDYPAEYGINWHNYSSFSYTDQTGAACLGLKAFIADGSTSSAHSIFMAEVFVAYRREEGKLFPSGAWQPVDAWIVPYSLWNFTAS